MINNEYRVRSVVAIGAVALIVMTGVFFSSRYEFSVRRFLAVIPQFLGPPDRGGGGERQDESIAFYPGSIVINDSSESTDSKNVTVSIHAQHGVNFTGTVDVLLSNVPDFSTAVPFRYAIDYSVSDNWPKTVSWDLCFGLPKDAPCELGQKNVYARFYVKTAHPEPAFTPLY